MMLTKGYERQDNPPPGIAGAVQDPRRQQDVDHDEIATIKICQSDMPMILRGFNRIRNGGSAIER